MLLLCLSFTLAQSAQASAELTDCSQASISVDGGTLIVSGLDGAPVTSLQVFSSTWATVLSCFADCPATKTMPLPDDTYHVYVKYYTAGYQFICEKQETVVISAGGGGGGGGGGNTCPLNVTASVSNIACNDNGTPGNPNDDTFTFTVLAQGGNPWGWTGGGFTGDFGTPKTVGPFPISGGTVSFTIVDNDNPSCTVDVTANPPATCSNGDPCAGQGGDSDGDGVCDNQDCQPNNPNFPATPGSSCNDGDPNTSNDQVTADGCGCAGTPGGGGGGDPDCANIDITAPAGKIKITGLDGAPISSVQIFNSSWGTEFQCFADCGAMYMDNYAAGDYFVYVKYFTAGYQQICVVNETVTVTNGGGDPCDGQGGDSDGDGVCDDQDCKPNNPNFPATPGSACNDGNPNTTNDQVTANGCGCQGTPVDPCAGQGGDSDGDGVCDDQDCKPNNPNFPATPGSACNDGNPNTTNDQVTADGCGCQGSTVDPCAGQGGDSDGDGVCDDQDCKPNNPNFPATPGSACNDGNPNTTNDQVTADGCGCAGTPVDPCNGQGGDSDGDGVCDNQDCKPNNPNFPATPGSACNDGNANTDNDQVTADGCGCAGTPTGPAVCETRTVNNTRTNCGTDVSYAYYADHLLSGTTNNSRYRVTNGVFTEFVDGTARFTGTLINQGNSAVRWHADVTFSGRTGDTPAGSPKTNGCYGGNGNDFYYYTQTSGTLTGKQHLAGAKINVTRKGEAFQVGTGANLQDHDKYGASGWLMYTVVSQPNDNGIHITNDGNLDFNFRLSGGQPDCPVPTSCNVDVLFYAATTSLNASDAAAKHLLEQLGYSVHVQSDGNAGSSDLNGKELIVISSTVHSGTLNGNVQLKNVNIPIIVWESYLFDNYRMTGTSANHDYGSTGGKKWTWIDDANHPLAAGYSGDIQVYTSDDVVRWGKPNSNAARVARLPGTSGRYMVFGYDTGAEMIGGFHAPAKRIGFFGDNHTFTKLTNKGKDLFRAAAIWATGCGSLNGNLATAHQELLRLRARQGVQAVELSWSSNLGYVTTRYEVEHSTDGTTWEVIDERTNARENDGIHAYETVDNAPAIGVNYYRVRAVFRNGDSRITQERQVIFNDLADYAVFPNPTATDFSVNLEQVAGKAVTITCYNAMGRAVRIEQIDEATATPYRIPVQDWTEGTYYLLIQADGLRAVGQKVQVVR